MPTPSTPPCGPDGFPLAAVVPQGYGAASYEAACGGHDICYETCNSDKALCDRTFHDQITASCRTAYPYPASGEDEEFARRGTCLSRASLYAKLVAGQGQAAYDAAQKIACECCATRLLVRAKYSKASQTLTAFVSGTVTDEGFQFEIPFPVADGDLQVMNLSGGSATALVDSRSGCLQPSVSGTWDQLRATKVTLTGNFLTVEGERSVAAITLGSGEGDCATMSRTEPARTEAGGIQAGLPPELFTSSTPPTAPLSVAEAGWTFTFTTQP